MDNILNVSINSMCDDVSSIWFVSNSNNLLCRYNINERKINYMTLILDETVDWSDCKYIAKWEEYLILIPYSKDVLVLFNIETQEFTTYKIPEVNHKIKYRKTAKFYQCVIQNNKLVLMPGEFPFILFFNLEKKEFESKIFWYGLYGKLYLEEKQIGPYKGIEEGICKIGNRIYFSFFAGEKGKIGELDTVNGDINIYGISDVDSYFSCIQKFNDYLILVTRTGSILYWNRICKKVIGRYNCLEKISQNFYHSYELFHVSIVSGEKLYLFSSHLAQYIIFNLHTHKFEEYDFQEIEEPVKSITKVNEDIYILTNDIGKFYRWKNERIETYTLNLDNEILAEFVYKNYIQKGIVMRENTIVNLETVLLAIKNISNHQ